MQTLSNPGWGTQTFGYDHRDRMTSAHGQLYYQDYTYDKIGNLTSKYGVVYGYGSNGNGTGSGPHQARVIGGQPYNYDANGNLLSGGVRAYVWNAENKPSSITSTGVTETYQYDADGNRVTRTRSGVTSYYAFGAWEQVGTNAKRLYSFNGRVVAQRDGATNTVIWLHPDHQGGTLLTTNQSAGVAESLWYTPWGAVGGGGVTQTKLNYTGQRLDDTGLLFYNARYYDPGIGRFVSADSVLPDQKNPQARNRYTYVLNNPMRYTDPSGHCIPGIGDCQFTGQINWADGAAFASGVAEGAVNAVVSTVTAPLALAAAASDPASAVQSLQAQAATVARGAEFLASDPAGAAAALNDDPRGVGRVLGEAAATAAVAAGAKGLAGKNSETIYRAVSEKEYQDIVATSRFRSEPSGLSSEGKYFAEQADHAAKWGDLMFPKGDYHVVSARVSPKVSYTRWERLDRIGPARFYEGQDLPHIRYKGEAR
jgi:RHS repeat-associated protein